MRPKNPKKSIGDTSTQTLLKTAKIADTRLVVTDRYGTSYYARRASPDTMSVTAAVGYWSGLLRLDAWADKELAYWEGELDELTPAEQVWVLCEAATGRVLAHLLPEVATTAKPGQGMALHAFRLNNAAGRTLPALGEVYAPPPEPVRPRRTRGLSRLA